MLVLTRKLGENVLIGEHISVRVVNIENNKVQLGIQAPEKISIYRQELVDKVKAQNFCSVTRKKRDLIHAARQLKELWGIED